MSSDDLSPTANDASSFATSDTDMSFDSPGRRSLNRALPPRISSASLGIDHDFDDTMHKSMDPCATENESISISHGIDAVSLVLTMIPPSSVPDLKAILVD